MQHQRIDVAVVVALSRLRDAEIMQRRFDRCVHLLRDARLGVVGHVGPILTRHGGELGLNLPAASTD